MVSIFNLWQYLVMKKIKEKLVYLAIRGCFLLGFFILGGLFDHFFYSYQDEKMSFSIGNNNKKTIIETPYLKDLKHDYIRFRYDRKVTKITKDNIEKVMYYYHNGVIDDSLSPQIGYFIDYSESYTDTPKWFIVKDDIDDSEFQPIKR